MLLAIDIGNSNISVGLFDKAGKLSFPDHRVRCQILRCRLCFLESSGRGGTDSIG